MLLREKIQCTRFSPAERGIAEYILKLEDKIEDYSSIRLAKETYSTPAAVVRFTKKLGYHGWTEFKKDYINELRYLKGAFQDVDANFPFNEKSTDSEIVHNICSLYEESIKDTAFLLDIEQIQKAVDLMVRAKRVVVFAVANMNFPVAEFVFLMDRIGKPVIFNDRSEMMPHMAYQMNPDECAIIVSYTGETLSLLRVLDLLEEKHVPIIAITSIGGNTLSKRAQISLPVSTREKIYSKIAGFASITSIRLVLDVLYSCYYARDFQKNTDYKLYHSRRIEVGRKAKNAIVSED